MCQYITLCLPINQLIDPWVVAMVWLLWISQLQHIHIQIFEWMNMWYFDFDRSGFGGLHSLFHLRNCQTVFHSGGTMYIPTCKVLRVSISPSPPQNLLPIFFYYSHASRYKAVCHWVFNMHFLDDLWYWTYFHALFGNLCIFFGEKSIQIHCPFLFFFNCFN